MAYQKEARRAVRRERAPRNVHLAIDIPENAPHPAARQAPYAALRLIPIWSDDRRYFQGWEAVR